MRQPRECPLHLTMYGGFGRGGGKHTSRKAGRCALYLFHEEVAGVATPLLALTWADIYFDSMFPVQNLQHPTPTDQPGQPAFSIHYRQAFDPV